MSNRTKKARAEALKKAGQSLSKSNKHITKISATSSHDHHHPAPEEPKQSASTVEKASIEQNRPDTKDRAETALKTAENRPEAPKSVENTAKKPAKRPKSSDPSAEKPLKSVFILFRPFVALGRYLRDSWREIRQVRWPNRKATWKMTFAVIFYCLLFLVFVLLLDTFFTFLINLLIK